MEVTLKRTPLLNKDGTHSESPQGDKNYLQHDAWALMMLMRQIDGLGQAPHMRVVMKLHDIAMQAWMDDADTIELEDEQVTTLKSLLGDPKGKFKGDELLQDFTVQRTIVEMKDALGV